MRNEITYNNIEKVYEDITKTVKNKKKIFLFEVNKVQNICNIIMMLRNNVVGHDKYNVFLIYEPKCRLIMSQNITDKVINHFVAKYYLETKLTKYLDMRNVATRKNMGTDYAIRLVKKYINVMKNKYNTFYILKIDISKYFYSIDHSVLKDMLKDKLDNYEYNIVKDIIDSTDNINVINEVNDLVYKSNKDLPIYRKNKGLPIGNMTSQFLSIFYLEALDHYIVHDLHLKYYIRYMDDFIIFSEDIDKLKKALAIITNKLKYEYKLEINKKKTFITNSRNGFSFLGYVFKVINNKTIIKIKQSNINGLKKKIKKLRYEFDNNLISYEKAFCSIMTYTNIYKYASRDKVMKIIDRYWYEK